MSRGRGLLPVEKWSVLHSHLSSPEPVSGEPNPRTGANFSGVSLLVNLLKKNLYDLSLGRPPSPTQFLESLIKDLEGVSISIIFRNVSIKN